MEATIASLEDQLAIANEEKDIANSRADSLASDLQAMSDELHLSNSELRTLQEEVSVLVSLLSLILTHSDIGVLCSWMIGEFVVKFNQSYLHNISGNKFGGIRISCTGNGEFSQIFVRREGGVVNGIEVKCFDFQIPQANVH